MLSEQVRMLVARELKLSVDQVGDRAGSDTIERWDSMAHINICLAVQSEFGIEMSIDEIAESASIPALVALIQKRGRPT